MKIGLVLFAAITFVAYGCCQLSKEQFKVNKEDFLKLKIISNETVPEMHAGKLPLDEEMVSNRKLFFWRFESKDTGPERDRLIIWFNGGPGCSSMDGALLEVGPFSVNKDGFLHPNKGSLHTRGNLMFVDQPIGTGFSTVSSNSDYHKDLKEVTEDFLSFMKNYFHLFPEDQSKELIFTGESYAGTYLPYFADALLKYRKTPDSNFSPFNLTSIIIGNGWIDPNKQSLSYIPYFYEMGLLDNNIISLPELVSLQENCQNSINSGNSKFSISECDLILVKVLGILKDFDSKNQCINAYDLRLRDSYPSCGANWPEDLTYLSKFLAKPEVLKTLHVDDNNSFKWQECDKNTFEALRSPTSEPSVNLLPGLLESGLKVVLYTGDMDLVCNRLGIEQMINRITWGGSKGFSSKALNYEWIEEIAGSGEKKTLGNVTSDKNLTNIVVFNASHMVPLDVRSAITGIFDISNNFFRVDDSDRDNKKLFTTAKSSDSKRNTIKNQIKVLRENSIREKKKFTFVVACLTLLSTIWIIIYYFLREKFRMNFITKLLEPINEENIKDEFKKDDLELADFPNNSLDVKVHSGSQGAILSSARSDGYRIIKSSEPGLPRD